MQLHTIASAVPSASHTQLATLSRLRATTGWPQLRERSRQLVEKILSGDSSIHARQYACPDAAHLHSADAGTLNRAFELAAPSLATAALQKALAQAQITAAQLDALFICTCTGYLCPGLTSYVAEQNSMRPDAVLHDVVGLGCGAALPTLRAAAHYLTAHPAATVAVIAVEVCSTAFFMNDDPGVLISLCLFGDGASASIWSGSHTPATTPWTLGDFRSLHLPQHREKIRFANDGGKLRNQLHRDVPALAAAAVRTLWDQSLAAETITPAARIIAHPGGRDVILAIQDALPGHPLHETQSVLHDHGNMSSPSVLFALERALAAPDSGPLWLTAFGAGFTAHSATLSASR